MTEMTNTELQKVAGEALDCFERAVRGRGNDTTGYYRLKDDSPEWVADLVYAAHGTDADGSPSFPPDDYRYRWTRDALEFIEDYNGDDPMDEVGEFADQAVSVYTGNLLAWLSSNLQRPGYCDDAAHELGYDVSKGIVGMISLGQYTEASEVFGLVLNFLTDRIES